MPDDGAAATSEARAEDDPDGRATGEEVLTYEGTALRLEDSHELTNALRPQFVLLLGERDAGKTTLLAELHHSYLKGPFAGYLFAGSRTLIGFEERCFLSRLRSELNDEDTERTKSRDIRLLHLCLAPEAVPSQRADLLFGDVSGERYRDIKASVDEAQELAPVIRRADHVVFLVDGDRLSQPKTKMLTQSNAKLLLRCLLEAGGLSDHRSFHFVFSKWDYVAARKAEDEIAHFEAALAKTAGPLVPQFHRVAARITNPGDVPPGFGLAVLLRAVLSPSPREPRSVPPIGLAPPSRAYLRYRCPPRQP